MLWRLTNIKWKIKYVHKISSLCQSRQRKTTHHLCESLNTYAILNIVAYYINKLELYRITTWIEFCKRLNLVLHIAFLWQRNCKLNHYWCRIYVQHLCISNDAISANTKKDLSMNNRKLCGKSELRNACEKGIISVDIVCIWFFWQLNKSCCMSK